MSCREHEIAWGLKNKIISKRNALSNLDIPSAGFSQRGLREGLQARNQRRENARFTRQVKTQKAIYDQQLRSINTYLDGLEEVPNGDETEGRMVRIHAPVPETGFFNLPRLGRVRGLNKRRSRR